MTVGDMMIVLKTFNPTDNVVIENNTSFMPFEIRNIFREFDTQVVIVADDGEEK